MTTIAVCDERPCAYGFMRADRRIYNFVTEGWDLLDDEPRPVHYVLMARFSSSPKLSAVQHADVPPVVSSKEGAWMVLYSLDDDGKIIEAIDVWPPPWVVKPLIKGGFSS